ncbi:MAG: acetyltransferase [Bryobacterales bacterium]|nr:acetyltransferase [Bryobacterales bacterium]
MAAINLSGYLVCLVPVLFFVEAAQAQTVMQSAGGGARLFSTDIAVLEAGDPRTDLPCKVTPSKPVLGFDLRFHAGYEVSVPLRELAGSEDLLTIVFRVSPAGGGDPVHFSQRIRVPAIEDGSKGEAFLQGTFDLGEGTYDVAWLMRNRSERVCSFYWQSEASLPSKDKDLKMAIAAGMVEGTEPEPFREEPPIEREERDPLNVKVLVNFAPQNERASSLQPIDTGALISILRRIAREPRIGRFSVVAFNIQEQRILYRQDTGDQIDFPSLGDALDSIRLGTVDLQRLGRKNSDTEFLQELIVREMASDGRPDALIFAGPKVMLAQQVSQEALKEIGKVEYPIFYMNYNFNPQTNPWRDAIGNAVRFFKGQEYTISRPRDLWFAWSEIVGHIVELKLEKGTGVASSQ